MSTQEEKGKIFRALHERNDAFLIPNPWDIGPARLLAGLGFEALATTSAGYAFSAGKLDGAIGRDEMMNHIAAIAAATELPVSADLENGFGDAPELVAETIRMAAQAGVAGGSIEDLSGRGAGGVYELEHAVERVRAAAEAARGLPFPFTLTARAENYLAGRPDLADTIKRLQAYQEAGADVLYAPGLRDLASMKLVASSVSKPLNVVMSAGDPDLSAAEMEAVGVKRISVGGALSRLALAAFMKGAREMKDKGGFTWMRDTIATKDLKPIFRA